jgi:uncharacterized protein involved in exopolysaccharide biosynthesis
MDMQNTTGQHAMIIDLAQFVRALLRRKGIVLLAAIAGLAAGLAWHALAVKRYSSTISFVRNQAMDEASPLGGLGPLSLLGMGGQTWDPPLLKFIDKYLKSREFISQMRSESYLGQPLPVVLNPKKPDTTAEDFYSRMVGRIKVVKETGLISIKVWDRDPGLSLHLTNLVFERFQTDFDNARRKAILENLAFANDMVAKSSRDLTSAGSALRDFLERNRGLGSPALEQQRNELMMKERLAQERYLMSEKERGALEIKNERKEQSLVIIEKPFLPSSPDYPKRIITVALPLIAVLALAFLIIGFLERHAWISLAKD